MYFFALKKSIFYLGKNEEKSFENYYLCGKSMSKIIRTSVRKIELPTLLKKIHHFRRFLQAIDVLVIFCP